MALSEGFRGFMDMLKGTFTTEPDDMGDEDVFETFGGEYLDGNAVRKPQSDLDELYPTQPTPKTSRFNSKDSRVVSMPGSYVSNEVMVIEPRSFSESAQIVKKLIDKKTVILHLDLLDKEQSQRTIDFVCGASHALQGSVQKISESVVIFTPSTVALSVENAPVQSKFVEAIWNKPL